MIIDRSSPQYFPSKGLKIDGDLTNETVYFTLSASDISTAPRIIDLNSSANIFIKRHSNGQTTLAVFLSVNNTTGLDEELYYWDFRKADGTLLANGKATINRGVRDSNNGQTFPHIPAVTVEASAFQNNDYFKVTTVEGAKVFIPISLADMASELAPVIKPILDTLP
jgi:hypothetical protein